MKNPNQMKNTKQLYYFAYLPNEKSFVSLILNGEKIGCDYQVTSIDGETSNPSTRQSYLNQILITKRNTDSPCCELRYEMYCIENDPQLFFRKLFSEYKDYEKAAKAQLADIENHLKIIAEEALKL